MGRSRFGRLTSRTGSVGSPVRYQVPAADGLARLHAAVLRIGPAAWPRDQQLRAGLRLAVESAAGTRSTSTSTDSIGRSAGDGLVRLDDRVGQAGAGQPGTSGSAATASAWRRCRRPTSPSRPAAPRPASTGRSPPTGTLRVTGSCLAAKTASSSSAGTLQLTSCTGGQRWQLGSNAVLTNLSDGRCLADTGAKNGSRAVAAVCQATPNNTGSASTPSTSQQWLLPAGPLTSGIAGYCASNVRPRAAGRRCHAADLRRDERAGVDARAEWRAHMRRQVPRASTGGATATGHARCG